jgi:hypothetical protein
VLSNNVFKILCTFFSSGVSPEALSNREHIIVDRLR